LLVLTTTACLLLLLQVLNDSRIKHYFDATDMKKQVCLGGAGNCPLLNAWTILLVSSAVTCIISTHVSTSCLPSCSDTELLLQCVKHAAALSRGELSCYWLACNLLLPCCCSAAALPRLLLWLQRAHQAAFMTYAFGGANEYAGRDMAAAHKHLLPQLTEEHFNAVVENFVATLQELGVAQQDIDDACAVVATTKDAVLSK
jgi:hypothetical protein